MTRSEYRSLELSVGRDVLGKDFDRIFSQNDPQKNHSRSALRVQDRKRLKGEPYLGEVPRLKNRVWTDHPTRNGIRQLAVAGEGFYYDILSNAKDMNHVAMILSSGSGYSNAKPIIKLSKGETPQKPLFVDRSTCTVLNLNAHQDKKEAAKYFLTRYFNYMKRYIEQN
ncbi:MAG: hypothetical protein AAGA85_16205 [Bacteroidota bacterium]